METIENLKIHEKMRTVNLDTQMDTQIDTLGYLDTQMGVPNSIWVSIGHPNGILDTHLGVQISQGVHLGVQIDISHFSYVSFFKVFYCFHGKYDSNDTLFLV